MKTAAESPNVLLFRLSTRLNLLQHDELVYDPLTGDLVALQKRAGKLSVQEIAKVESVSLDEPSRHLKIVR